MAEERALGKSGTPPLRLPHLYVDALHLLPARTLYLGCGRSLEEEQAGHNATSQAAGHDTKVKRCRNCGTEVGVPGRDLTQERQRRMK